MSAPRTLFSSASIHWRTPAAIYKELDAEFHFTFDPCPINGDGGLERSWKRRRVFCNPPYGRAIASWLAKAREARLAVFLLPARTDTIWWHEHALKADEIRFIQGRLRFNEGKGRATFPSVILVYRGTS
jgi:site-specific DNA-methyltransferase (adenine-specific)